MGRPISHQQFFGANAGNNIKVHFYNGYNAVRGYIVKQKSSNRFLCEDENGLTALCTLVAKPLNSLLPGEMSITVLADDDNTYQVTKISRHLTTYAGQVAPWTFVASLTDGLVQIEEAGIDPAMDGATDLAGVDFDTNYPVPGSGTYRAASTALNGITYGDIGTPFAPSGAISTVSNAAAGLLRSKYDGNFTASSGDTVSAYNLSYFTGLYPLKSLPDTYVSWGNQSDGAGLGQNHFSIEWKGYVKVPTTQHYNVYIESDDTSAVWIGSSAVSGFSSSNCIVSSTNKSLPSNASTSRNANSLILDSTKWYPVRIWMSEFGGNCKFQIYMEGADGTKLNGHDLAWEYNTLTGGY
jgi:GLEYA domain